MDAKFFKPIIFQRCQLTFSYTFKSFGLGQLIAKNVFSLKNFSIESLFNPDICCLKVPKCNLTVLRSKDDCQSLTDVVIISICNAILATIIIEQLSRPAERKSFD